MFFRFVTSGEIQRRREFFEPFVMGLSNGTLEQVCGVSVFHSIFLRFLFGKDYVGVIHILCIGCVDLSLIFV